MRNRKLPTKAKADRKGPPVTRRGNGSELDHAMTALLEAIERVRREGGYVEFNGARVEIASRSPLARPTKRAPTALEAMRRGGLLGRLRRAPADLSTNPEYMSGFGDA